MTITNWDNPPLSREQDHEDANRLPFDADAMLAGLQEWVECESPTYDPGSVNRMMDIAGRALIVVRGPYAG
jgi:hypothetical protein